MSEPVIVVGAGVIGAAIAWTLARKGRRVSVIDRGVAAGETSGRSFGWLNASFYANPDHHRLRANSMRASRDMAAALETDAIRWPGCLDWEVSGEALETRAAELEYLGYRVERMDRARIARRFPFLRHPPDLALHYPDEGVAELGTLTRHLLAAAARAGAELLTGLPVRAIVTQGRRVTGVQTDAGQVAGGQVVLAAGNGAPALLAPLGIGLPLLSRPGVLFSTRPVVPLSGTVMVSPEMEFRQLPDGRLLAPTAAGHQGDTSTGLDRLPQDAARDGLARLNAMLDLPSLGLHEITVGWRPVPGDGLPVIGPAGPDGLYVTVMHSGATLAAITAEYAARELDGEVVDALEPYRIGRFSSAK